MRTGTCALRAGLLSTWIVGIAVTATSSGAERPSLPEDLQSIALRIAEAAAAPGETAPPTALIRSLRMELAMKGRALPDGAVIRSKYIAIATELARLESRLSGPQVASASSDSRFVDHEVVSVAHGGRCESAFGISTFADVKATLGSPGIGSADALYRFEAGPDGTYRVVTRSRGLDPALEVFADCATDRLLGSNDDDDGLDAAVQMTLRRGEQAWIHATNQGQLGGEMVVSVTGVSGSIAGTVIDASKQVPLANVQVAAVSSPFLYPTWAWTDQNGHYLLTVNNGSYYVVAAADAFVTRMYPNVSCRYGTTVATNDGCDLQSATVINVADNATTNIDLALEHGQQVSGVVRDGANQPLAFASVDIYDNAGKQLKNASADALGRFNFAAVPPATYRLSAVLGGYGSQMYNHVACVGPLQVQCDLGAATPLNVSSQDAIGIDFNLPPMAAIVGTVTGTTLTYGTTVCVLDGQGNPLMYCTNTDFFGKYRLGPLPIGSYYVYATATGYFAQIYQGVDCPADCASSIASAKAVPITAVGQVATADLHLHALPVVHGIVVDAKSSQPLANVMVTASAIPPGSYSSNYATTDANGHFTLTNTGAGQYYLLAQSGDHVDMVYPDVPCEQLGAYRPCDVSGASLLQIAPGTTLPDFDFALSPSGSIGGTLRVRAGAGSDLPAASIMVELYDSAGVQVTSAYSDATGAYTIADLDDGTYYAEAGRSGFAGQYLPQVWQAWDCTWTCAPTMGNAIEVAGHSTISGIDFALVREDAFVGKTIDDAGQPVAGVIVDLFGIDGVYAQSGVSDALGFYAVAGQSGPEYFVATEAPSGFVNQVYAGLSCPQGPAYLDKCSLLGGTPVSLSWNATQPRIINFRLYTNGTIFSSGFDP